MTSKKDYSNEEWNVLDNAALNVGGAVAAAAPSGMVGTVKEGIAIVNSMLNAARNHPDNQLIQAVVPAGINQGKIDSWTRTARGMLQQTEAERLKVMGEEVCQRVATMLDMKGNFQEAEEFKQWLLEVGQNVARSANEGGNFMNAGGVAVSNEETKLLSKLASNLRVASL